MCSIWGRPVCKVSCSREDVGQMWSLRQRTPSWVGLTRQRRTKSGTKTEICVTWAERKRDRKRWAERERQKKKWREQEGNLMSQEFSEQWTGSHWSLENPPFFSFKSSPLFSLSLSLHPLLFNSLAPSVYTWKTTACDWRCWKFTFTTQINFSYYLYHLVVSWNFLSPTED